MSLSEFVNRLSEAAVKGEKITVYFKSFTSIGKTEGYMKQVNGRAGGPIASVEFYKKNARKHATSVDSYYNPFWMVVKGWGHPDPDSGWEAPQHNPDTGVTTTNAKYSGASSGPQNDFLAGPGKNLKPWAMYKDKILVADDDVPRAQKEESKQMSAFKEQIRRIAEAAKKTCAGCGEAWPCSDAKRKDISGIERAKHYVAEAKKVGSEVKTAKVKRLTPKQLDKHIAATWSKVGSGVQVDIMDIGKIFKMATDAYGTTGTLDDVEAALKVAITKFQKNAKVQPSGGGPEKTMAGESTEEKPEDKPAETAVETCCPWFWEGRDGRCGSCGSGTPGRAGEIVLDLGEPVRYDMDRMRMLAGIVSAQPVNPGKGEKE